MTADTLHRPVARNATKLIVVRDVPALLNKSWRRSWRGCRWGLQMSLPMSPALLLIVLAARLELDLWLFTCCWLTPSLPCELTDLDGWTPRDQLI